jgi:hypothetical protein
MVDMKQKSETFEMQNIVTHSAYLEWQQGAKIIETLRGFKLCHCLLFCYINSLKKLNVGIFQQQGLVCLLTPDVQF